jgi:hypothetical protein
MRTREVGKAAQGILVLTIMVEDHAEHLMEFLRWKVPQRSQTHKDLRIRSLNDGTS